MKLNLTAFALACGIFWGAGLFMITWWIIAFDGPSEQVTTIGRVYRGYRLTPMGSVYGLVWGLVDGVIGGFVLAWLYNLLVDRLGTRPAS